MKGNKKANLKTDVPNWIKLQFMEKKIIFFYAFVLTIFFYLLIWNFSDIQFILCLWNISFKNNKIMLQKLGFEKYKWQKLFLFILILKTLNLQISLQKRIWVCKTLCSKVPARRDFWKYSKKIFWRTLPCGKITKAYRKTLIFCKIWFRDILNRSKCFFWCE